MRLKKRSKILLPLSLLLLLAAVSCATNTGKAIKKKHTEEAEGRSVTKTVSDLVDDGIYVEIIFNSGSSMLTEKAKVSLSSFIKSTIDEDKIDEIIVLSWSDEEYPLKNLIKLSKLQKDLVEKRNENVESYIKSMKNVNISTYNMTDYPNSLSKLLYTLDRKLKNSLVEAGLIATTDSETYAKKASHSVIFIKLK